MLGIFKPWPQPPALEVGDRFRLAPGGPVRTVVRGVLDVWAIREAEHILAETERGWPTGNATTDGLWLDPLPAKKALAEALAAFVEG